MLAVTHHTIVQVAAARVGRHGFTHYAVLGDDIVIADAAVAESYHSIMTKVLGVEINLSKSLVSKHSFEFAKRLVTMKGEVTPVGAKNLLVALKSLKGIPSVIIDLLGKGSEFSETTINRMFNSIPTVRKSQSELAKWNIVGPFGVISSTSGLSTSMRLTGSLNVVQMISLLGSVNGAINELNYHSWESNFRRTLDILVMWRAAGVPDCLRSHIDETLWDPSLSPLWSTVARQLSDKFNSLSLQKPEELQLFNEGTFASVNFNWLGGMEGLMPFIENRINDTSRKTVSATDPFADSQVCLPLSITSKGETFFQRVKLYEELKQLH